MLPFGISRFKIQVLLKLPLLQFSLLWVVLSPTYSNTKPTNFFGLERQWHYLEWLCWSVLSFLELDFDILLAVLAGVLYSIYLLMSKKSAFSDGRTLFHDNQHPFINGIFRCLYPT
jgi:hypothetical protein